MIATVLLVALVVILAATVGGLVLGSLSETPEPPPQTQVTIESERIGNGVPKDDALVFEHVAGETFGRGQITITVGPDEVYNDSQIGDVGGSGDVVVTLEGLVVQVDAGPFDGRNKPGTGAAG